MNVLDAAALVGKDAVYRPWAGSREAAGSTLRFAVSILDVRSAYGRIDLLIEPCGCAASGGEAWVSADKVEVVP